MPWPGAWCDVANGAPGWAPGWAPRWAPGWAPRWAPLGASGCGWAALASALASSLTFALMGVLLAGCASEPERKVPVSARYSGELPGCDGGPMVRGTLVVARGEAAFSPGEGATVLTGAVLDDGAFAAVRNTRPPNKPPFTLHVSGKIAARSALVTYLTPRCRSQGVLRRME